MKKTLKIVIPLLIIFLLYIFTFISINVFHLKNNQYYQLSCTICFAVTLFLSISILLIEIGSLFFDKNASTNTIFSSLAILCFILTSSDFSDLLESIFSRNLINEYEMNRFIDFLHLASYILFIIFTLRFYEKDYGLKIQKSEIFCSALICIFLLLCFGIFSLLHNLNYDYVYLFCLLPLSIYRISKILFFIKQIEFNINAAFLTSILIICLTLAEVSTLIQAIGGNSIFRKGIDSFLVLLGEISVVLIYIDFSYRTTLEAYKKDVFERKMKEFQTSLLVNQISPHYIFNSLNTIKQMYTIDQEKGNFAIDLLSKNLRQTINATSSMLIPLENELESVLNYVNFENLKTNIEYNVIFNIDNTNIKVPPLSIVTLVENAVKHSKIETKNDGYIEISTSIEDGKFVISIVDNGVGFDAYSISENSCGIKNTKDRFALLLNGELEIFSKINCGTKILIKIPFGEEYERVSD